VDDPVWDAPGVTHASQQEVPTEEYARWASDNALDFAFFDNAYEFDEIRDGLRANGVRTVGRFVWEHFSDDDVPPAQEAFDVIYSMTSAEHERYGRMGIEPVRVHFGIHPELLALEPQRDPERITLVWPGSFMGRRKPIDEAIEALGRVTDPRLRLLLRGQVKRKEGKLAKAADRDPRIEILLEDLPTAEHLQSFANADVCLTPSRWEGLGLPLYEATAVGMPILTNDDPPMNEVVIDGLNGLLFGSHPDGTTRSGIDAKSPDVVGMARAIEEITDDERRAELARGALEVRDRLSWSRTVDDLSALLEAAAR
jgi:glycosyltransferase involved in cell wall biosynthesis